MTTLKEIEQATRRLAPLIRPTPVSHDPLLSQRAGAEVWLKWENQQITGAFKLRGALNVALQLPDTQAGLLTASAGNHGLGLAYAARQAGVPVTVYLPADAPQTKVDKLRALGAELRFFEGGYGQAERAAIAACQEPDGPQYVSPYDHPHIIAGAGSLGLEMLEQIPHLETILVPVGGGGLIAGAGLALKGCRPTGRVIGVQGETSAVLYADWHGRGINNVSIEPTLADGLAGEVDPSSITRPILKQVVDDFVLVSEEQIARAIAYVHQRHGQVIEGAAAVGVAALLTDKIDTNGQVVGLVISGGNIDPQVHADVVARQARR